MDEQRQLTVQAEPLEAPLVAAPEAPPRCEVRKEGSFSLRMLVAGLCCIATVLCKTSFPAGADWLQRWIVGDGSEQVQQAFFRLEDTLQQGGGLSRAVEAFCQTLGGDAV